MFWKTWYKDIHCLFINNKKTQIFINEQCLKEIILKYGWDYAMDYYLAVY